MPRRTKPVEKTAGRQGGREESAGSSVLFLAKTVQREELRHIIEAVLFPKPVYAKLRARRRHSVQSSLRIVSSFHTPLVLACLRRTDGVRHAASLASGREDEDGTIGGFQRRRDRDHHHDHGAGNESASRRQPERLVARTTGLPQLCPEFRLCRHLLEQSPSPAACHYDGNGRDPLGEPAPVVLAVVVSVCYRLDGGESFQRTTHRTLRPCAADGRHRVLPAPAGDHPLAGIGLDFEKGGWPGLEGQALACAVYGCDCCYRACAMDLRGDFRGRCADLVHSRPANRTGSDTEGRLRSTRIRGGWLKITGPKLFGLNFS